MKIIKHDEIKPGDVISILSIQSSYHYHNKDIPDSELLRFKNLPCVSKVKRFSDIVTVDSGWVDARSVFVLDVIRFNEASSQIYHLGTTCVGGLKIMASEGEICWIALYQQDNKIILHTNESHSAVV